LSGLKHVTGEAVYVDDMPTLQNEGYGALVLSTRAYAKIISVDASKALAMPGVYAFVNHEDLPSPKANWWGSAAIDEVFFAVDEVVAYGQPIGMIVAKSKIVAQKAARAVTVVYGDLGPPILTIEQAVEKESFHPQYDRRIARGEEINSAMEASEHVLEGCMRMGGQEVSHISTGMIFVYNLLHSTSTWRRWPASCELLSCAYFVFDFNICSAIGYQNSRVVKSKSFRQPKR
jgi:xanthine dehydrogenase/oxidase